MNFKLNQHYATNFYFWLGIIFLALEFLGDVFYGQAFSLIVFAVGAVLVFSGLFKFTDAPSGAATQQPVMAKSGR